MPTWSRLQVVELEHPTSRTPIIQSLLEQPDLLPFGKVVAVIYGDILLIAFGDGSLRHQEIVRRAQTLEPCVCNQEADEIQSGSFTTMDVLDPIRDTSIQYAGFSAEVSEIVRQVLIELIERTKSHLASVSSS